MMYSVWLVYRVIFLVMYALGDRQTPCIITGDVEFEPTKPGSVPTYDTFI
ncbi:MAG: hypothetical protein FWH37_09935 [Candidatus Bathyarchaeota archaeon]|nr:hypothetical protein [Candidatus Termiticorpusculum sp.]